MKLKYCIYLLFTFLISAVFSMIYAQSFERVENVTGLEGLSGNGGVAVADYDGDFDLDIFVVAIAKDDPESPESLSRLFRNNDDGTFTDVTSDAGLTDLYSNEEAEDFFGLEGFKHGAFWGDYNNDGFPDLLLTNSYSIQLFRNLGNGTFLDFTETTGITGDNTCRNTGAAWFDYDKDGYLDIYISDWDECGGNTLYRNNGNGTFSDLTSETSAGGDDGLASYTPFPFDFNEDGWLDIYVTNDFDEPNDLFISQNGSNFVQQAQQFGLDSMADDMGVAIGDYNNDGHFDFFITAIDKNILYTNQGNNTFIDEAVEKNVDNTGWAWGTRFADFDLDGDEDLFVVNGYEFELRSTEYNVYFRNLNQEGQDSFEEATEDVQLSDLTMSVEAVDFDYDNDGDLDLFVTNTDQAAFLYENKLLNFNESAFLSWFKLKLEGTVSNRDAIGTAVTLITESRTLKRYYSGVGFLSQNLQPVHFGLNSDEQVNEIQISWPSGIQEAYYDLDINSVYKVIEGQGIQLLDVGPSIKVYGCTDPQSCSYNPDATVDDGSCTYLPSASISGSTLSGFLSTESYSYPIGDGSIATWTVEGGELLDGQGSGTILVKWGLEEFGRLTVRENNTECFALDVDLEVNLSVNEVESDKSIARIWNEALLEAIRGDLARPTVHARNLFHASVAMYDAWAIYDEQARPYLIGNTVNGFDSELLDFDSIEEVEASRKKAISYAMYRLLSHRFQNSPEADQIKARLDLIMAQLDYETEFTTSTLYQFGNPAALGNYIAETIINYGLQDGSREQFDYDNAYYEPVNPALVPTQSGNPNIVDPNRWQPLSLDSFIDQSGNPIDGSVIDFLSPEWGDVHPFAMDDSDQAQFNRDGNTFSVYNNPADPPYLETTGLEPSSEAYKWGFSMVSVWGAHLSPDDGVMWDISPASIGSADIADFPSDYSGYPGFYNFIGGGDIGSGHAANPVTGLSYEPQIVPRGDYARVLAEFWADGPDSETPPGHWFTILNYVNDNPVFEKRFTGEGELLDPLEWDVKAYFIMGGAMHDSAISAWSIKGWYDYIRPISAIRYMADMGQSTDESLPNYHPEGIPLIEGYIELVEEGDPLAGFFNQHQGKIKLFTWRGHEYIQDTTSDEAGVGWILAENFWPYQRPTFVTPPFAGFVSGHSTYSRAAAEVMTLITGDAFFPGGMGEFMARQNEFLVFEDGPSVDIMLQWATYRDASDQCSLSRIWGGIHPPADDIPGRKIGERIGQQSFEFAVPYFSSDLLPIPDVPSKVFPNPVVSNEIFITNSRPNEDFKLFDIRGRNIPFSEVIYDEQSAYSKLIIPQGTATGLYILNWDGRSEILVIRKD
ncbi:MAG: VCBS repeat-containing protein [Bacteroidia bacterium]|nr:VCBS repeat-containing protein [Bacteroidia bacterium]